MKTSLRRYRYLLILTGILPLPISAAAAMVTADEPVFPPGFSLGILTPASSVAFSHVVPVHQAPAPGVYGFADDWVFSAAAPAVVDSWVASFSLGSNLGISGLQMRLVEWTPSGAGTVLQGWSMATSIPVSGEILRTATLGPYAPLAAGTPYALQVQGTAYGLAGGAYSGGLNLAVAAPVPLPAGLPLFLSALGLLGLTVRHRT